jgi:hypothetical protein
MGETQHGPEEDTLRELGDTGGSARPGGEGGGGAEGDESFTIGGPRGQDAERGEYYEPEEGDGEPGGTSGDGGMPGDSGQ